MCGFASAPDGQPESVWRPCGVSADRLSAVFRGWLRIRCPVGRDAAIADLFPDLGSGACPDVARLGGLRPFVLDGRVSGRIMRRTCHHGPASVRRPKRRRRPGSGARTPAATPVMRASCSAHTLPRQRREPPARSVGCPGSRLRCRDQRLDRFCGSVGALSIRSIRQSRNPSLGRPEWRVKRTLDGSGRAKPQRRLSFE